jgi:hypothetical protein
METVQMLEGLAIVAGLTVAWRLAAYVIISNIQDEHRNAGEEE